MSEVDELIAGAEDEWLAALPPYQRDIVEQLLDNYETPEEAAVAWLAASGPADTYTLGSVAGRTGFYNRVKDETRKFLCNADDYAAERDRLLAELQPSKAVIVAVVSAAISPALGLAAGLVAPAIVLTLIIIVKVGLNAWCDEQESQGTGEAPTPDQPQDQ